MIFRTYTGQLIEINKYKFINDKLYYTKLLDIKQKKSKLDNSEKTFNNKNNK